MKLLILIVSIVVVLTVDGRNFLDEFGDLGETESHNSAEETLPIQDPIRENDSHHFYSNTTGHMIPRNAGSQCKAKGICIVMGGSCVTNATLCGGRLVPGCKGKNCQCCVSGTLETKIHNLEQNLKNMQANISNDNLKLSMELKNLKDNLTNATSKLNVEFKTMRENLTDTNSKFSTEFQSMRDNLTDSFSNVVSKLDSLKTSIEKKICPASKGFFIAPETTNQCMKVFREARITWSAAVSKCKSEGLVLARPLRPISLRKYLVGQNDDGLWFWLDARGDGSTMRWQRDNKAILSNSDSNWYASHPGTKVTSTYCLQLMIHSSYIKSHPNQPYYSNSCEGDKEFPICEMI